MASWLMHSRTHAQRRIARTFLSSVGAAASGAKGSLGWVGFGTRDEQQKKASEAEWRGITHWQASTTDKSFHQDSSCLSKDSLGRGQGATPRRSFHFNAFYSAKSQRKPKVSVNSFDMETVVVCEEKEKHHELVDRYEYRVEVQTGMLRGAGTTANVYINLLGNLHQTGKCLLRSPDEGNDIEEFRTGSNKTFHLLAPNLLGRISGIELSLEYEAGTQVGSEGATKDAQLQQSFSKDYQLYNWYVEKLIVYSPTGKRLEFPCKCWFGSSERGTQVPSERRLIPFVEPSVGRLTSFGRILPKPLSIQSGAFVVPHPDKVKSGVKAKNCKESGHAGEDAYFKCFSKSGSTYGMGVADGVWMWSEYGIDAGQFSKALMNFTKDKVSNNASSLLDVVKSAAEEVKQNKILGSSTFCVTLVDIRRGTMQIANLGDSGVLILGKDGVKFKTPQQEHSFGYPHQLGHHEGADKPEDAMVNVIPVAAGDTIIMGTDGLFDNLSEEDAAKISSEVQVRCADRSHAYAASQLANELGKRAFQNSMDKWKSTPYSIGATDAFDMVYSGGKKDDMTVLTAIVH